jgi:Phosphate transporter family
MVDAVAVGGDVAKRPRLEVQPNIVAVLLFVALLASGVLFAAYSLETDIVASGMPVKTWLPFLLLVVALLIALGFEFVNGFHETANAVATVIYTHSMPANVAVVWSGFFNFLGVLLSSGAVAFGIISLLPVELILQVGSGAGFARSPALPGGLATGARRQLPTNRRCAEGRGIAGGAAVGGLMPRRRASCPNATAPDHRRNRHGRFAQRC